MELLDHRQNGHARINHGDRGKHELILSRKGFDSSAGGMPSPILPDGRMVSLPIPDKQSPIRYADIKFDGESIVPLVSDLTHGRIPPSHSAHLDPDLFPGSLSRLTGWRPIFGQTGAAQAHLGKNGVQAGDLFLFFGLFRHTTLTQGIYAWLKGSQPVHVIWGWLQIGEILPVDKSEAQRYNWAAYHPHFHRGHEHNNVIYVSSQQLRFDGVSIQDVGGAGIFRCFSRNRQLTAHSAPSTSIWDLPGWFFPENGRKPLTYHGDLGRWRRTDDRTELRTAARGQEFILDCGEYPEAVPWLSGLLKRAEIRG